MNQKERTPDFNELLQVAAEGALAGTWTALPGIVAAVDLIAQTVQVQPAIQGKQTAPDGTKADVTLSLLVDVPIVFPRAGGFALTLPVAVGDECLVVFGSRCIDSWWQTGEVGPQVEQRMHDLSDGFAIFGPTSQAKKLSNVSTVNVQLRDEAGTTFLEITPDGKIKLAAAAELTLQAPSIKIIGPVVQSGGTYTMTTGITLDTHKHLDVQTGTGTSGVPTT